MKVIDKKAFLQFFPLPGLLGERLFSQFDSKHVNHIEYVVLFVFYVVYIYYFLSNNSVFNLLFFFIFIPYRYEEFLSSFAVLCRGGPEEKVEFLFHMVCFIKICIF